MSREKYFCVDSISDEVKLSRLQNHLEETVYVLPLSPQEFLVLI